MIDEVEFLVDLLNELIHVNGFYSGHIDYSGFKRLFPMADNSTRRNISEYVIPIRNGLREILLSILDSEGEQLVSDLVHFKIEIGGEIIMIGYDNLSFIILKEGYLPNLENRMVYKYLKMEVKISNRELDYSFD